ncbi:MAG: hypothetical protein AAFQ19_10035 [Pseudomonadota bacterium]
MTDSGRSILTHPARARLFIDVQHGLANRMRAMISAASVAQRTDRDLVVIWRPDHHCNSTLRDLFVYPGPVIEDDTADLFRRSAAVEYNYVEIEPGAKFLEPILPDMGKWAGQDVYVRSPETLRSPHRVFEDEQDFLRKLVPSQAVLNLVSSVRHPNDVAIHVRMSTGPGFDHLSFEAPSNWPAERHAELTYWRQKSTAAAFMARLDRLIAEGRADTVFLAADLASTYDLFAERYGARVNWLARADYDRSVRQLQYALADMILLAHANLFLASTWSSFSDMAQRLARPGRLIEQSGEDF